MIWILLWVCLAVFMGLGKSQQIETLQPDGEVWVVSLCFLQFTFVLSPLQIFFLSFLLLLVIPYKYLFLLVISCVYLLFLVVFTCYLLCFLPILYVMFPSLSKYIYIFLFFLVFPCVPCVSFCFLTFACVLLLFIHVPELCVFWAQKEAIKWIHGYFHTIIMKSNRKQPCF